MCYNISVSVSCTMRVVDLTIELDCSKSDVWVF